MLLSAVRNWEYPKTLHTFSIGPDNFSTLTRALERDVDDQVEVTGT